MKTRSRALISLLSLTWSLLAGAADAVTPTLERPDFSCLNALIGTDGGVKLGEGEHAVAWFVMDASGRFVVAKRYFSHALDQVVSDFSGLRYLRQEADEFPFAVVRPLGLDQQHLYLEYVPGVNLESLMRSILISPEEKAELRALYLQRLGEAIKYFEKRCFDYQYRAQAEGFGRAKLQIPHALRAACDRDGKFIEFIIKSDNILVDRATRQMTLVDPY